MAATDTGYIAQRGTGPYELLKVNVLTGATPTVFGSTTPDPFGFVTPGPLGVIADDYQGDDPPRYFPYGANGTGTPVQVPSNSDCRTVTTTYLYCSGYGVDQLTRLPLSGGPGTTVSANVRWIAGSANGIAFLSYAGTVGNHVVYRLSTWADSGAVPVLRLDESFQLQDGLAMTADGSGSVLVSRGGALSQAGIWLVPPAPGTPARTLAAPPRPRTATQIALGPGSVAWSDNNSPDGNIWQRDLSSGTQGLTAGCPSPRREQCNRGKPQRQR